jgi:hypothetical protein
MILNTEFDRDIVIYAFRYTLGRHSYAPGLMMRKLDEIWDQLNEWDKELILKEILEYYEFLNRIKPFTERDYNDQYDIMEWMNWREKKINDTDNI